MKKSPDTRGPSRESLRALPEVDFAAHRVRRNPWAKRVAKEGIVIVEPKAAGRRLAKERGPSRASLREMPEVDLTTAGPNPYAARIASGGITLQVGRGRPVRGSEVGPTRPKSVRLPDEVWERLAERASREGVSLHAALRAAILAWLNRAA